MMDIISLMLTVFGLVISGAAYWKADDAKKAVQTVLKKRNADEDLRRLRNLIATMEAAKEAVAPWTAGMPLDRRTGRDQQDDLAKLGETIDCLRTKAPLDLEDAVQRRIKKSATVLDNELNSIVNPTDNQDHWKAALSEIQLMIPRLEQLERSIRDAQISI
ncbi:hypothetical protein [Szabonella alba]|uniref:Uncharacterized protein n=1 Tax=Szabonella alba TaxID=2804194 RepID=A0A8K0VBN6_9RHOB|nr:hypothetical protein [Szabonella alba]MBL4918006.1 hypothetical protein [Szabonella alba]